MECIRCSRWLSRLAVVFAVLLTNAHADEPQFAALEGQDDCNNPAAFRLDLRYRIETAEDSGRFHALTRKACWEPEKTAIIVCDVWDTHTSPKAAARVVEMAPQINRLLVKVRKRGRDDHSRTERLHGLLRRSPRTQTGDVGSEIGKPAEGHRQLVLPNSAGRTGRVPARSKKTDSTATIPNRRKSGSPIWNRRAAIRDGHGFGKSTRSKSPTKTTSATTAWKFGASSNNRAFTMCSWSVCTPICACSVARSACGRCPKTANESRCVVI